MASYKDKQRRSHFESFANKIFTGIRELKYEYAEKRAIWELFQNALDTVAENGVIHISHTDKGLLFKHNGRPFKDDEFGGLIKQFSVGKSYGDNTDKLGQYGTGFISTHVYGKQITVNGSIQTDDGNYKRLTDFNLDRNADTVDELTDKLLSQDYYIEELCDNASVSEQEPLPYTTFEYKASKVNHDHIVAMLDYIETILPFIFCFNDKLSTVVLSNSEGEKIYKRNPSGNLATHININGEIQIVSFIEDDNKQVKVVLPGNIVLQAVPKLFLFYPLMETNANGINFIIHARDFKPNKERDFLHLDPSNDELVIDVNRNQKLLEIGYQLVINEIQHNPDLNFLEIIKIEFVDYDLDFEKQLKRNYVEKIRTISKFEIEDKFYSLSDFEYFDQSILDLSDEDCESVYNVLSEFLSLPPFRLYKDLCKNVNNWNEEIDDKFKILDLAAIVELISIKVKNYHSITDKNSFQQLVKIISKDSDLLFKFSLLPNIHGDFHTIENLAKWEIDEPVLVAIVDISVAHITQQYIHRDFTFLENIASYNREKFKDEFSKFCNSLIDDFFKGKVTLQRDSIRFSMLLETLHKFIALNKKTQLNLDLASFYEAAFSFQPFLENLESPTIDTNFQPAIKLICIMYIQTIDDGNLPNNVMNLQRLLSMMYDNSGLRDELLHKLPCIPNQLYELKSQMNLKKDLVKDEKFKDVFDEIVGGSIRESMVQNGFEQFLQHAGYINGMELGEAIETTLNPAKQFIPVQPEMLKKLIELIEKISENPLSWEQWLRNISAVKEEILMHKFKDEKTRSSLFSILTKDEKTIELLGDLAKVEDLQDLVTKGKERQREEGRKNNHLSYINYIGLKIQNLIQAQLDKSLADTIRILKSEEDQQLINQEAQNGQDFIIYKNQQPIYFIEVKSKWDENGRFALSKNQTEKCAAEKGNYAVISVNVDRYKRKHKIDIENIPFEDLNEFVKVNDDLSEDFNKLVFQNVGLLESKHPKLIEYRGSIPQDVIDVKGKSFDEFVNTLILKIQTV